MSRDGKNLICCPGGRYGKVIVPDGVTEIANNAFCWCSGIEMITLPSTVKSIGQNAFGGCNNLTTLILPSGISEIKKETFAHCSSLTEIVLPDGVRTIGDKAFFNCTALDRAVIPASVTSIANSAFTCDTTGSVRNLGGLVVFCPSGSQILDFCLRNSISYVITGGTNPTEPDYPGVVTGKIKRIAGYDRINTAVLVSQEGWLTSETVVLANAFSYPDALAGVPLAAAVEAPILLTSGKQLEPMVVDELTRLGARKVYILGGTSAINSSVERSLNSINDLSVSRIAGKNRYETAVKIALELEQRSDRRFTNFFLVSSQSFADTLSVSTVAALDGNPILYVPKNGDIDDTTAGFMYGTVCRSTTIIGGTAAVSKRTENSVRDIGFSVLRLSGKDRYSTALAVCAFYQDRFIGKEAILATGSNFPDALSGGAYAALKRSPLVLISGGSSRDVSEYINSLNTTKICVMGGQTAVPDSVLGNIIS